MVRNHPDDDTGELLRHHLLGLSYRLKPGDHRKLNVRVRSSESPWRLDIAIRRKQTLMGAIRWKIGWVGRALNDSTGSYPFRAEDWGPVQSIHSEPISN